MKENIFILFNFLTWGRWENKMADLGNPLNMLKNLGPRAKN